MDNAYQRATGKMQGIKLEEGGDASSINMATLAYKYWEQRGDELYLTVKALATVWK